MNESDSVDLISRAQALENNLRQNGHIKDRTSNSKNYPKVFVGKDTVPIIIKLKLIPISTTSKSKNEANALKFGNELIEAKIIEHVAKEHSFKNANLYYQFIAGYDKRDDISIKRRASVDLSQGTLLKDDEKNNTQNEVTFPNLASHKKKTFTVSLNVTQEDMAQLNASNTYEPSMTYSVSNTRVLAETEEKRRDSLRLQHLKQANQFAASKQDDRFSALKESLSSAACTVIVFGASGHLAKTKTFPALYDLYKEGVFPDNVNIVGYARSKLSKKDFDKKISIKLRGNSVASFLSKCTYFSGKGYDDDESYKKFAAFIAKLEDSQYGGASNRICYLATPPTVFVTVCERIKKYLAPQPPKSGNWMRVIIEKPFGKDLESSNVLHREIGAFLAENEIYRIDHYLAKEMVQNIIVFRFSNVIWDSIWNRKSIRCVKISMKETAALDGRGGYYDEYGVIRDVLQNHLFQVLSLIAMEQPCSLKSEDVRDEKVKVLKCIKPMDEKRTVIGQYVKSADKKKLGWYCMHVCACVCVLILLR